jgi:hypothetical protein
MVPTEVSVAAPVSAARRRPFGVVFLVGGLVLLVGYALLPWEWSFIDDTGALAILHGHGVPGAVRVWYRMDLDWGLFRPAWWLYGGTFYLLPAGAAHAVRLAMLGVAVAGPVLLVPRVRPVLLWASAVAAANVSLYRGLWYVSLQELSGLCFVGLGLLARRRLWVRVLCFLVAAWFKAPFAWLLVGYGAVLLVRRATRWWGALCLALGAVTLGAAVDFARSGTYTVGLRFGADSMMNNARTAAIVLAPVAVVLVAGALATRARPAWDPLGAGLVLGGVGYLANLLPWQTGLHYASPYVYLIGVGGLLLLRPGATPARPRWLAPTGLAVAVTVALLAVLAGGRYVYRNAATTTGLRDCVLGLPDGSSVGYNRVEAWDRLNAIIRYHRPETRTTVVLIPNGAAGPGLGYYIWEPDYGPGTPSLRGQVVCRTPLATVYRTH